MDFPAYSMPMPPITTTYHFPFAGFHYHVASSQPMNGATSQAWSSNNLAYYYPFRVYSHCVATQLLLFIGATSSGNIDVGIYDSGLRLIVSAGTTAMSVTVNTVQEINITDTELQPGDYLLGVALSTTAGTVITGFAADENTLSQQVIYEQASALPLPDPAVPVVSTQATPLRCVAGIQFVSAF